MEYGIDRAGDFCYISECASVGLSAGEPLRGLHLGGSPLF